MGKVSKCCSFATAPIIVDVAQYIRLLLCEPNQKKQTGLALSIIFFGHLCKLSLHKSFLAKILSAQENQHQENMSMYDPYKSNNFFFFLINNTFDPFIQNCIFLLIVI